MHQRKPTPLIPQPEISTGSRFFQPGLPVTIKRPPARSTLKIPSRAPPNFFPSRVCAQDLQRHVSLSLSSSTISRPRTWSDSASEESRISFFSFKGRVLTYSIPKQKTEILKQNICIFLKMDMV